MAEGLLAGRVIAITGASSGIGQQFARAVSGAGAKVVLGARRLDRIRILADEIEGAETQQLDVTSEESRIAFIAAVMDRFGQLDGLVNNAGISSVSPAMREGVEDFDLVVQTNLVGPYSLARHAAEQMRKRGGTIVNIASIAGYRATGQLPAAGYTASKAGLLGLTRELGTQWGRYGIRVNALSPGFFETEMTAGLFAGEGDPPWLSDAIPLGRTGAPGELNGALIFLLSDLSSYMTGQSIVVDGGLIAR